MIHPIPEQYRKISQAYGVVDCKNYPITCRHIGVDYGVPINTGLITPKDCVMTRSGYSPSLGFWCELKIDDWYLIAAHLRQRPLTREYKQGEVFGYVGASGRIQGIHSHLEGWVTPRNANMLTKSNWNLLTFDINTRIVV